MQLVGKALSLAGRARNGRIAHSKVSRSPQLACGLVLGLCMAMLAGGCASSTKAPPLSEVGWVPVTTPSQAVDAEPGAEPVMVADASELDPDGMPVLAAAEGPDGYFDDGVVLQPYDVVRMRFLYWPELDDEQWIRPDGKISLLMVGEVEAQGLTPNELQQTLMELYEPKIREPEINVTVTELAGNRVYVGGEVMTPGLIFLGSRLTALEAIMQAGGFNEYTANKAEVVIVRQAGDQQLARTIDLRAALQSPSSDQFFLHPYDVIYVPRTKIVRVNQFVEQYLDNVLPRRIGGVGLTFSRSLNSRPSGQAIPIPALINALTP